MINHKIKLTAAMLAVTLGATAFAAPLMNGVPLSLHVYTAGDSTDYTTYPTINLNYESGIVGVMGTTACQPSTGCAWSNVVLNSSNPTFDLPALKVVGAGSAPVSGSFAVSFTATVGTEQVTAGPYDVSIANGTVDPYPYTYSYSAD